MSNDAAQILEKVEELGISAAPDVQEVIITNENLNAAVKLAIAVKIRGEYKWPLSLLKRITEAFPDHATCRYEYALLKKEGKDLLEAAKQAEIAYNLDPSDFRFQILYVTLLSANGSWAEANRVIADANPTDEDQKKELLYLKDFNQYLQETPKNRAIYITYRLRDKYYWMNASEVVKAIDEAIGEQRPFSLIRLGDGDGAHFSVSPEDEKRYPHLHARVRKQHTEFLLGVDNDPMFTGYESLTKTLMSYVKEADILGAPYASWIEHEYDICSPVTITCLMNVNRHLWENDRVEGLTLCDQLIHMQLHQERLLEPVIKKLTAVTVISCLDGLPAKIREMFGVQDVELIKIPSETYAPHLYGEKHLNISLHYPHAFWPTVQQLSQPHNGRVFLIAAGTFGKFYSTIIKRNGGIALDLGSLVDGWMKLASRPGYAEMFN